MPFTLFHLGPALMIGLFFFSYLDFPTFIIANLAPDIEPAISVVFQLFYPWYGWFHSLEGSTVTIFVTAVVLYFGKGYASKLLRGFKLKQVSSFKKIFLASILGVYSHLILDVPLHAHLELNVVPVGLTSIESAMYAFCVLSFLVSLIIYKHRINL